MISPGLQHGALDGQLLDRRAVAVAEPGTVEQRERADRGGDQRERDQPQQPGGQPAAAGLLAGGGARLHQPTSNRPIQPSCANSDWCAWNMNWPLCGNRSSRMPRWPWHCMIVSVNSARLERRAGREVVEEVGVHVERVDLVELEHVHEVDPHQLVLPDPHRLVHVREADRVDRVDLVGEVEVRVEAVHHHHQLVGLRAALLRVDDERAVHAARDVLRERLDMAVVEVQAERLGVELVGDRLAGLDHSQPDARQPVHAGRVDAVEVDRVRMRGAVAEADAQPLALTRAQRRRRNAAVVGPGRELHAGRDLDLLVVGDQLPLAQHPAARQPPGLAMVEVAQQLGGVEAVGGVVDGHAGLEPGMVRRLAVAVRRARGGRRVLVRVLRARRGGEVHPAQLRDGAGAQCGRQGGEHPPAAQAVHAARLWHA